MGKDDFIKIDKNDLPDEYAKVFLDEIKHTLKFIDIDIGWDKK